MAKKDGKYIEFNEHELYEAINEQRRNEIEDVVSEIDAIEAQENRMTEEQILLENMGDKKNTERKKQLFINEIKSGLGEQIKQNPMDIRVVKKKKTLMQRIKEFFTKF
jgi:hypothetical protein